MRGDRMNIFHRILFVFSIIVCTGLQAQTVGVLVNEPSRTTPGFTLFAPFVVTTTFLIDNDGQLIHTWPSAYNAGQATMLLNDGSIMRCGTLGVQAPLNGGGAGGVVERIAWDGSLMWRYVRCSPAGRLHHDLDVLPNGNILVQEWYPISRDSALALGRRPSQLTDTTLWLERLLEIRPQGTDSGEVVWSWDVVDHLIQDADSTKPNFGVRSEHPERIDINAGGSLKDWLHCNSVRYDPDLNEVLFSAHGLNEIMIISRATNTLVYRWGNPKNYGIGDSTNQMLFGQHDARWVLPGRTGAGNIGIFNNGVKRPGGNVSSLDEIVPPRNTNGTYTREPGTAFGPTTLAWHYVGPTGQRMNALILSGWTRQTNDNAVICYGDQGLMAEVTLSGDIVWKYLSPVTQNGIVQQGQTVANNPVFKINRYVAEHPAFVGKDLHPHGRLEDGVSNVSETSSHDALHITFNMGMEHVVCDAEEEIDVRLDAYDVLGRWLGAIHAGILTAGSHQFRVPSGTMFIRTR